MDFFDDSVVPLLQDEANPAVIEEFRGLCRAKFNALAVDATDVMNLEGYGVNEYADEVKDRLHVDGRTATARS